MPLHEQRLTVQRAAGLAQRQRRVGEVVAIQIDEGGVVGDTRRHHAAGAEQLWRVVRPEREGGQMPDAQDSRQRADQIAGKACFADPPDNRGGYRRAVGRPGGRQIDRSHFHGVLLVQAGRPCL
ncbi:hypothetical protein [Paraburkholderia sediminicola]|uniref:hypothetical protein n=1 Tax=Paraburkholderia sediminicola TaxID=458836 RepID=UPI0038B7F934